MAARRWLFVVVSLASLLILAYGGVLLAYSVPVTDGMEAESRLPGMEDPTSGRRARVLPVRDPARVATFSGGGAPEGDLPGALLVVADGSSGFPAASENASVVRALAYVTVDAEGRPMPATLELTNLTQREGDNVTTYNATLDVGALAGGQAGFLVKPDATDAVRFVPEDRVVGTVEGYERLGDLLTVFLLGGAGFVIPLVFLVMTHRPSGRPGTGEALCAECRRPMPGAADFCPGCGAWKKGRG